MDLTGLILAGAAFVVLGLAIHSIAKTKQISHSMLETYEKMLADVRQEQDRELAERMAARAAEDEANTPAA